MHRFRVIVPETTDTTVYEFGCCASYAAYNPEGLQGGTLLSVQVLILLT